MQPDVTTPDHAGPLETQPSTFTAKCPTCAFQATKDPDRGWGALVANEQGLPLCPNDGAVMDPMAGAINLRTIVHGMAEQSAQVEAARRTTEPDLPALNGRLPFPAPKFDACAALHAIAERNAEVAETRERHDNLKAATSKVKKELDEQEAGLGQLICDYEARLLDAERVAREPYLEPTDDAAPAPQEEAAHAE